MTFQPILPVGGLLGWTFLQRTLESQQTAFKESRQVSRATDYFRENIGNIKTAEDLVADRRLLEVALGAYGLDADINAKAFIREVLEEGTLKSDALANRLADKRYRDFSAEFGFGDLGARTNLTFFADRIIGKYEARQFEIAVGNQDPDMRLALGLKDGLADILKQSSTENAYWFSMMGSPPVRSVFETAFGLPSSFGQIDVDQQREVFQERARSAFGVESFADFADPEVQEEVIRLFLVRSQIDSSNSVSGGSIALTLLQSVQPLRLA